MSSEVSYNGELKTLIWTHFIFVSFKKRNQFGCIWPVLWLDFPTVEHNLIQIRATFNLRTSWSHLITVDLTWLFRACALIYETKKLRPFKRLCIWQLFHFTIFTRKLYDIIVRKIQWKIIDIDLQEK